MSDLSVKMFKMQVGESILISNKKQKSCLLVDCGSMFIDEVNVSLSEIKNELNKYNKKEVLITHFHEDHINGFFKLCDEENENNIKFDKVYIPNIFQQTIHPNYIDVELLAAKLNNYRIGQFGLGKLLIAMVKHEPGFIHLVDRGLEELECSVTDIDILWPLVNQEIEPRSIKNIYKKLALDSEYNTHAIKDNLILTKIYDISDKISTFVNNTVHDQKSLNEIINKYESVEYLESNDSDKLIESLHNLGNKISIVFQIKEKFDGKSALFTGDIDVTSMKKILMNTCQPYKEVSKKLLIVKAPHHGTDSHYINLTQVNGCDYILISNGHAKNCGKISKQYSLDYEGCYKIICTNTIEKRCQCFDSGNGCNNKYFCNIGKDCNSIIIPNE